jgi:hypothetical protein
MLFDLRGRRRRAVQATYLLLALLMGGGLVFFGIGGDVSGGLFDAFGERNATGNGNEIVEERVDRNEERLRANPENRRALSELVRDHYQLATADLESGETLGAGDRTDLRAASGYWQRYLEAEGGEPDDSLASLAVQLYSPDALNQPKEATRAMTIVAGASNDFQAYLQLVQFAVLAKDERTADLATQKAVDLAPKNLRKDVKKQAAAFRKAAEQQQAAG